MEKDKISKSYLINGDYIKFHTINKELGIEIIEEYNMFSEEIESRKIKQKTTTGKEFWTTEIGDESFVVKEDFLIKENNTVNVYFLFSLFSLEKTQRHTFNFVLGI